jgi:iron complex transport system ATP-binding protein
LTTPVLELRAATVVKSDRRILDALTLTIAEGEHTAIIGPNGAGKSALVSLLTHDDRPLRHEDGSPSVLVFGESRWNVFDLRAQLGIISADLHHRFVLGNNEGRVTGEAAVLSGFLATQGILRYGAVTPEMRSHATEGLTRMGVAHLAKRRLDEMSTGEARRVLLARALVTAPRALILDEPTTGLDLVARHDFMERVRHVARAGTTLILITHHIEEIVPEIQRVVLVSHGQIAASGSKRDILTSSRISALFGAPIALEEDDGYYYARPASARTEV